MKSLIVAVLLLLGARGAEGQTHSWNIDTSCLVGYFHGYGESYGHSGEYWDSLFNALYNLDSILVDTCAASQPRVSKLGPHFKTWGLWLPWSPKGSIVEVPWMAIDTAAREIRAGMRLMFDSFCPFVIRKVDPEDTSRVGNMDFELRFLQLVPYDSAANYLFNIRKQDPVFEPEYWDHAWPATYLNKTEIDEKNQSTVRMAFRVTSGSLYVLHVRPEPLRYSVLDELGAKVAENVITPQDSVARIDISILRDGVYWVVVQHLVFRILKVSN